MSNKGTINIIGNGFDIAHVLKTSYWDFWEFLKKSESPEIIFLCKEMLPNLENLWSALEGKIPEIINSIFIYCLKADSEGFKVNGLNRERRKIAYHVCKKLWDEFYSWILSEDWDPNKPVIRKKYPGIEKALFNNELTTVVNFNYTDTPSLIYIPVNDIYVHGNDFDKKSIIFGHPDSNDWSKVSDVFKHIKHGKTSLTNSYGFMAGYDDIKRSYEEIFNTPWGERFVKNQVSIAPKLRGQLDIFCKYSYTEVVNVFGHSFGELDDVYFAEILSFLSSKGEEPVWNLYYYSDKDLRAAKRMVDKFDIKGVRYIPSQSITDSFTEITIPVIRK